MVGHKSGTLPRRFCIYWFLSAIALGFFIYPALTFGVLNLGGKFPNLDGVKRAYEVKTKIAKRFQNERVLYIVGGSSAYFGIDAALMERQLGRPVVNYGVHAGLGLDYLLFQLEKIVKPGDSVLLAFELYLLSLERKTDFLHAYVSTYDKRYLVRDGLVKLWKEMYNTPLSDWKLSMMQWGRIIEGKTDYCGNLTLHKLLIGERGDSLYKRKAARPLHNPKLYELGERHAAVLAGFISFCTKNNVQVYYSWETAVRHPDYFDEKAVENKNSYLSFFKKYNVAVLDECTDHLYPEFFYSNTYNHLNEAGRRVRTEKLISSLRHTLATQEEDGKRAHALFLLDPSTHETKLFNSLSDTNLDYRVYSNDAPESDETINDAGIIQYLNSGGTLYFNDRILKHLPAYENRSVQVVERKYRSFREMFYRYSNHVFFIVQNGPDLAWDANACLQISQLQDFFSGTGYRVALVGTGDYSDVKRITVQNKPIKLGFRKNEVIRSFRFPFDAQLLSLPIIPESRSSGGIHFDGVIFKAPSYQPGIWCVVFNPYLGVVSERIFFEKPEMNIEAELYCVGKETITGAVSELVQ